jgi:hypothetical protein
MPKSAMLGEAQLTQSAQNIVSIELVEPDDLPAFVRLTWPLQPTVIDPPHFRDSAAALVKLFSDAHVTLTHIRARRYIDG